MNPNKVTIGETKVDKPAVARYFLDELALIDPRLKVLWHPKAKKYLIVSPAPHQMFKKGYVVEMVVDDGAGNYAPCDRRTLGKLLELKYDRDKNFKPERFLKEIDSEEEDKAVKADVTHRLMTREFMLKVNKLLRTKTFVLNGGKKN